MAEEELKKYIKLPEEMGLKRKFELIPLVLGGLRYDIHVLPSNTITILKEGA